MAAKGKGNIFYEILIVILAVGLIAAIMYPSKIWQQEETLEKVCQARMDAIYQMELRYRLTDAQTFTDSLALLKDVVFMDKYDAAALDTIIKWDNLVVPAELKEIVMQRDFPTELRELIRKYLKENHDLGNLAKWDDLQLTLFKKFAELLDTEDAEQFKKIQSSILWAMIIGEDAIYDIFDSEDIPARVRTRTRTQVLSRGVPVYETRGWEQYYKAPFVAKTKEVIATALREDVWTAEQKEDWELEARAKEDAALDAMSETEKDSVWDSFKLLFWGDDREKTWMNDRDALWAAEGDSWKEENAEDCDRVVQQKWESWKKPKWSEEAKLQLPDSLRPSFPVLRDSLWRVAYDSLVQYDFPVWKDDQVKEVKAAIYNIWQTRRRVTWEDGAYQSWQQEQKDSDKYWNNVKDRLWKMRKDELWRDEKSKLGTMLLARKNLILSVKWADILDEAVIDEMVDALDLPDNEEMWSMIKSCEEDGRALSNLGIAPIFRDVLFDRVDNCPVTHTAYVVQVIDTSDIKYCNLYCPIIDTAAVMMAYDIDPVTKDTSLIELSLPFNKKLFGGGEIRYHGDIVDNKQSWDKKGK